MRTWLKPKVVAVVTVAVLGTTTAAASFTGEDAGRVVIAEFTDAGPILEGQDVKVHGVTVGTTGKAVLDAQRKVARVPLHLDGRAFPLHSDASAAVEPLTLLGERFVNLDPGTDAKPLLAPNGIIPTGRTSTAVDLQEVVNALDDPTASSLAALVVTLGRGASGNGENIADAMKALAPAMEDTDALVRVLNQQNDLLGSVIDRVTPVTAALATDDGNRLGTLVGATERMLAATASEDKHLRAALAELPATLRQARKTLTGLTGTSKATTRVLGNIRPTTDNLSAISEELVDFADSADPALASARPVLERADELLDLARPVAQELRKAGPDLKGSAKGAKPIVTELNDNLGNVLSFIRYWALTTNGRDGLAHYFRGNFVLTPDSVTGLLPGGGENGAPDPGTESEPRERVDEPTSEGPLPGGLLEPSTEDGGVTGLNREQEKNALGFLLGGR